MTRLYRSTRDKVLTGLTGGLAEAIGIDSTLLRIVLLISIPFTGGAVIPVYFIAALIFPKEPGPYPLTASGPKWRTAVTVRTPEAKADIAAGAVVRAVHSVPGRGPTIGMIIMIPDTAKPAATPRRIPVWTT